MKFVCIGIVFVCMIAGVFSDPKCQVDPPNGKYLDACKIGNLTVTNMYDDEIINGTSCNLKNTKGYIPQYIKFNKMSRNVSQSYLLAVVDLTTNQLLGMMSNLTMQNGTIPTSLKIINKNIQTIKGWSERPNATSAKHTIQYLVFEEHRNNSGLNYTADWALTLSPFNLFVWIKSQESSGISICGPVAGGNVVLFPPQTTTAAPTPRPRPRTTTTTTTTTTAAPKIVIPIFHPIRVDPEEICKKECKNIKNEENRKKCKKNCKKRYSS